MVQSYRTTWGPNPAVQAKPRDQNHHCFRHLAHLAKLPLQSTLHCASRLQRQRSRFYKALTRGKRNFKIKTPTGKQKDEISGISRLTPAFARDLSCISVSISWEELFSRLAMLSLTAQSMKKVICTLFSGS